MTPREKLSTLRTEIEKIKANPLLARPGKIILLVLALLDIVDGLITDQEEEFTRGE